MQSDFDILNKDINRLAAKNEVIEKDIKNIVSNFVYIMCFFFMYMHVYVGYRK